MFSSPHKIANYSYISWDLVEINQQEPLYSSKSGEFESHTDYKIDTSSSSEKQWLDVEWYKQ